MEPEAVLAIAFFSAIICSFALGWILKSFHRDREPSPSRHPQWRAEQARHRKAHRGTPE